MLHGGKSRIWMAAIDFVAVTSVASAHSSGSASEFKALPLCKGTCISAPATLVAGVLFDGHMHESPSKLSASLVVLHRHARKASRQ